MRISTLMAGWSNAPLKASGCSPTIWRARWVRSSPDSSQWATPSWRSRSRVGAERMTTFTRRLARTCSGVCSVKIVASMPACRSSRPRCRPAIPAPMIPIFGMRCVMRPPRRYVPTAGCSRLVQVVPIGWSTEYGEAPPDQQPKRCRIIAEFWLRMYGAWGMGLLAVDLALPEPVGDAVESVAQVIAVGVEGEAEQLGGAFLGGRRLDVSMPEGAVQLDVLRVGGQAGKRLAQQRLERRR